MNYSTANIINNGINERCCYMIGCSEMNAAYLVWYLCERCITCSNHEKTFYKHKLRNNLQNNRSAVFRVSKLC